MHINSLETFWFVKYYCCHAGTNAEAGWLGTAPSPLPATEVGWPRFDPFAAAQAKAISVMERCAASGVARSLAACCTRSFQTRPTATGLSPPTWSALLWDQGDRLRPKYRSRTVSAGPRSTISPACKTATWLQKPRNNASSCEAKTRIRAFSTKSCVRFFALAAN